MKKVIILKGLPASGKTTYAKNLLNKYTNRYKRVNKDDLRSMLDNSKYTKNNEKFILEIRNHIILQSLKNGKHVIVDDTNLHQKHEINIKSIVKGHATVDIVNFFHVTPEECIKRDLNRANSVGSKVILDMYNKFLKPKVEPYKGNPNLPTAVIFDIDGTLAHMSNRCPYNWSKVGEDIVDADIKHLLHLYKNDDMKIIIVTGRDGSCLHETEQWLEKMGIYYDELFIRKKGDTRKDAVIKKEIFIKNIEPHYNVKLIFDDRNQVVRMWRDLGLKCLQVAEGDF